MLYRHVGRSKVNLDVSLGLQRKPIKIVEGINKEYFVLVCAHIIFNLLEFFSMWKMSIYHASHLLGKESKKKLCS